jgi:hypothetical protein
MNKADFGERAARRADLWRCCSSELEICQRPRTLQVDGVMDFIVVRVY